MSSTSHRPVSLLSASLFAILQVDIQSDLRSTLQSIERGDRAWGFNLCRAIEHLWHLGEIRRNIPSDLQAIQQYLKWESEDIDNGLVDRSPAEHDLIWQAIAELYLKIAEFRH